MTNKTRIFREFILKFSIITEWNYLRNGNLLFDMDSYFLGSELFLEKHFDSKPLAVMSDTNL